MRRRVLLLTTITTLGSCAFALEPAPAPDATITIHVDRDVVADRPLVQIALLLDTSNSMDGLINQARSQLWTIVNEIGRAKRGGQTPRLQVALIEYGNNRIAAGEGYVRTVLPFTDNLDNVSEKLFALTTSGGDEYCGEAIGKATDTLSWSPKANTYKAIFIAGNEPFSQGAIDYRETVARAIGRGIVVNTIHCGERATGVESGWMDGAKRGEGAFSNIDQDHVIRVPRCPQDDEIERLSVEINVTYLPYGAAGQEAAVRQTAQDQNALAAAPAGASVERAAAKAGANYNNAGWDLVDAVMQGRVDLAKLKTDELPEKLRPMSPDERKREIESQAHQRDEIRTKINKLIAEREVARAKATEQATGESTLDAAIVQSVREQLKKREYDVDAK